ncbi:MAG TPA: hypothetical protein VGN82_08720 [Bosea sp. (in: a-proteobacteria)]|jgi:hypothetical protein|uniref:hypothetical protein n=1 Tax=Bosea sp. (in: a-proteobacteria) TaxID=1871050 RepID=UPI002E0E2EBF|nr:hypothetical protein [Bosea sp. (in: a-proteobacteria)]
MRKVLCAFVLAAMLVGPTMAARAWAAALPITGADPVAVITTPDDWKHGKVERGLEIKTPDEEIYIWFELVPPDQIAALQKEHDAYFAKEGVKFTSATETVAQEVNGRPWSFTEMLATSPDGPSIVRYLGINPKVASGKIIMMTYWASHEGHKKHDGAIKTMLNSIAFK